jgi:GR25 family glycosyltransferase involved in LPS biosynthesis
MKAHVVSLLNSPRRNIASQRAASAGLEICFFDAIDASKDPLVERIYSTSAQPFQSRYGRSQTLGELATILSHQALYQSLLQWPSEYHLILEDDFIPLVDASLLQNVLTTSISQDADVVLLGYSKVDDELEMVINITNPLMNASSISGIDRDIGQRCQETTCGAVGYFVSPSFLNTMANNADYGRLADDWAYHAQFNLKIMHVNPLCFREDFGRMPSSLEAARAQSSLQNRTRLPRYLRPLWRRCLGVFRKTQFHVNNITSAR